MVGWYKYLWLLKRWNNVGCWKKFRTPFKIFRSKSKKNSSKLHFFSKNLAKNILQDTKRSVLITPVFVLNFTYWAKSEPPCTLGCLRFWKFLSNSFLSHFWSTVDGKYRSAAAPLASIIISSFPAWTWLKRQHCFWTFDLFRKILVGRFNLFESASEYKSCGAFKSNYSVIKIYFTMVINLSIYGWWNPS